MLTITHRVCGTETPVPDRQVVARLQGVPIAAVWCAACQRAVPVREVRWSDQASDDEEARLLADARRPGG